MLLVKKEVIGQNLITHKARSNKQTTRSQKLSEVAALKITGNC